MAIESKAERDRKREKDEIRVINLDIDYHLSCLHEAMQSGDTKEAVRLKRALRRLSSQREGYKI